MPARILEILISLIFFMAPLMPSLVFGADQAAVLQSFSTASLSILSPRDGKTLQHHFTVEIAETDAQRAQGLMYRPTLAADRGMLFIFPNDHVVSMWMKNTLVPLDMLFVDAGGKIVTIRERAVPGSLKIVSSRIAVRAVLELAGGSVSRLGLMTGDKIVNARLGTRQ
jgi:hypothetical protein